MQQCIPLSFSSAVTVLGWVGVGFLLSACSVAARSLPLRVISPQEVYSTQAAGYSQAVAVAPGTLVFLSGQVGWNVERRLTGRGDLAAQTRQALLNVAAVLAASGARPENLIHLRIYVVRVDRDVSEILHGALEEFFGDTATRPASTLLYVTALGRPELLIEIEAVARIP
jgi:enamine deaminase RidA (YjgF/YER057c/UK114 family)